MTRIANLSIAAALAASLACAPAAEAKQSKSANTLKSKCTVAAVVFGTGWDIFGGSSSCSMLQDRDKVDEQTAKGQAQSAVPVKNGRKS